MNETTAQKKQCINPNTGKRCYFVTLKHDNGSLETFRWNTVYHVYNSVHNYRQLQKDEVHKLVWNK